jgi:probable rRNA maturation factor
LEVFLASHTAEGGDCEVWRARLEQALRFLRQPDEAQLSVTFVDDGRIRELNAQWRGKDRPTDVLSFPMIEPAELEAPGPSGIPRMLGDIVVSLEMASRQASEYGHSVEREIGFLLVHGLLHLLGEDHETPEQDESMRARQREILALWGLDR